VDAQLAIDPVRCGLDRLAGHEESFLYAGRSQFAPGASGPRTRTATRHEQQDLVTPAERTAATCWVSRCSTPRRGSFADICRFIIINQYFYIRSIRMHL
jgi:hypothetical protein